MLKRSLAFGICLATLPFALQAVKAAGIPTEKFSYKVNFEDKDPVAFWSGSKDYTVNFKGLTDEKRMEGKKCFKLDVTFGSGSEMYWTIPMPGRVPAEGRLNFTGSVFLGEGTTANRVDIGSAYNYPPSTVGGACLPVYTVKTVEKWLPIQGDLVATGKSIDLGVWTFGNPALSNVGVYMTDIILHFFGKKGDRVIIYLDDFEVDGEVPASAEYAKESVRRWAPIKAKIDAKVSEWETALNQSTKDAETGTDAARAKKAEISGLIENIKARGAMTNSEQRRIDSAIKSIKEDRLTTN